jgi:tRNA pseudouridine synthase 9
MDTTGRPITGRSESTANHTRCCFILTTCPTAHQIRVHLQYLGYPIVNDPLYGDPRVWGPTIGKGGVDLTPDAEEDHHESVGPDDEASTLSSQLARMRGEELLPSGKIIPKAGKTEQDLARLKKRLKGELLPRESEIEDDAVGGSPIYLSREAREVISKLRRQKDEAEDWAK